MNSGGGEPDHFCQPTWPTIRKKSYKEIGKKYSHFLLIFSTVGVTARYTITKHITWPVALCLHTILLVVKHVFQMHSRSFFGRMFEISPTNTTDILEESKRALLLGQILVMNWDSSINHWPRRQLPIKRKLKIKKDLKWPLLLALTRFYPDGSLYFRRHQPCSSRSHKPLLYVATTSSHC